MKGWSRFLILFGFHGLILLQPGLAERESQSLFLRFVDSSTGQAVYPNIAVIDIDSQQTVFRLNASGLERGGRLNVHLQDGNYLVSASAGGYEPMSAKVVVNSEPLPPFEFHMESLQKPHELQTGFLRSVQRAGAHLIAGFITDETTGEPAAGVTVSVPAHNAATASDSRGFFMLSIPLNDSADVPQRFLSLHFRKPGYQDLNRDYVELWSRGDTLYRIWMRPGKGTETIDERTTRRRIDEPSIPCTGCDDTDPGTQIPALEPQTGDFGPQAPAPIIMPKYIRVGRNCTSRTNCTRVEVYTIDTYCKGVLPHEWYSCWGNVAGGMDSLRAGAVAVRSYGVSFVFTPATSNYDICDSTSCQVFSEGQSSNANTAVDQTNRYVLLTSAGGIARSEYSAENNNSGCGDGLTGTGSSWPCISDPVCTGFASNGHGRGLCQWGSARWATGRRLSSSQACTSAAPLHGHGTKNWQQILQHYYGPGGYQLVQGATATINSIMPDPNPARTGSLTTFQYNLTSTHDYNLILGASISPTGTTNWVSDPNRDLRVSVVEGANTRARLFFIPTNAAPGSHDIFAALWHDRNNNSRIDTGDFVIEDRVLSTALQIRTTTTLTMNSASGRRGQTVALNATLREAYTNNPVNGQTMLFKLNGNPIGNAVTNASGVASLNYSVPLVLALGNHTLTTEYEGNNTWSAAAGSSTLSVQKVLVQGSVTLQERPNPAGLTAQLVIKQGANSETLNATLGASGEYSVETALAGSGATVSAMIVEGSWLRKRQDTILSHITNLNFTLPNGDINRDNRVDDEDLLGVLFGFGSADPQADLNHDGTVDDEDLLILLFNFGQVGDEQ
jgi:hypothetical protein